MTRRALAALIGVLLLVGACSSSSKPSSSSGSSSSSAGADAEAFCAEARDILSTLGGNVFTDPRGVQRIVGRVEALTPPAEIADEWPAFLEYVQQLATISPRDPDAGSKALDALAKAGPDVTAVGRYMVDTCKIDAAASDLSDFSDLSPRG